MHLILKKTYQVKIQSQVWKLNLHIAVQELSGLPLSEEVDFTSSQMLQKHVRAFC